MSATFYPRPSGNLALKQFRSSQSDLLDKIKDLISIGLRGYVELPKIIVCGDRSSGKSSVLEAISRMRFPIKEEGCTQFPIELVLRQSHHKQLKASIKPGESRTDENERKRLRGFSSESFESTADLPKLIDCAKKFMELASSDPANLGFSDDVLKVEISGPDEPELVLVDLPGLYNARSQERRKDVKDMVHKLAERYMQSSQSIILAVFNAEHGHDLQSALPIAASFDPNHERTMLIVTHLDTIKAASNERDYLDFIKKENAKLKLGCHLLRNRSFETRNDTDMDRDTREEEFFNQGRWSSFLRGDVGIEKLRDRLSKIVLNDINRQLPGFIRNIQARISQHEQALVKMGAPRTALQDQQRFLLDISSAFSRVANQALNGSYVHGFFGGFKGNATESNEFHVRRLRAFIRDLNEYFADAMDTRGCRRTIQSPDQAQELETRYDIYNPYMAGWEQQFVQRTDLEDEIKTRAHQSRGIELPGTANQLLVGELFRDQSAPWEEIAKNHILNCWTSVEYFTHLVLDHLTDEKIHALLMQHFIAPQLDRLKLKLLEKLDELTSYMKSGHPLPVGKSFFSRIQRSRGSRQLQAMQQSLPPGFLSYRQYTVQEMNNAVSQMQSSSDHFAAADIIDQMEACYDAAIGTFMDNVAILAIENCLLRPFEDIFTSQAVMEMTPEQVEKIAGEKEDTKKERARLKEELEKLRKGKQILSGFNKPEAKMRTRTLPSMARPPAAINKLSGSKSAAPHENTNKSAPLAPPAKVSTFCTPLNITSSSAPSAPITYPMSPPATTGNAPSLFATAPPTNTFGTNISDTALFASPSGLNAPGNSLFTQPASVSGSATVPPRFSTASPTSTFGANLSGTPLFVSAGSDVPRASLFARPATASGSNATVSLPSPFARLAPTNIPTGASPLSGQQTTSPSAPATGFSSSTSPAAPSPALQNQSSGKIYGNDVKSEPGNSLQSARCPLSGEFSRHCFYIGPHDIPPELNVKLHFQSISCMSGYRNWSHEELRLYWPMVGRVRCPGPRAFQEK